MKTGKPIIMIVDDERRFLDSMGKLLRKRGINVITAEQGDRAVRMVRGYPVDVALVDLKMPGMSGLETLASLREEKPELEVIIVSGQGSDEAKQACLDKGAFAFLDKPCTLDQILDAAAGVLRSRVMRKLNLDDRQVDSMIEAGPDTSRPEILRRLKALEQEAD